MNLIDYIDNTWKNDSITIKDCIINGFNHTVLIINYYLSLDEKKINNIYFMIY